MTNTKPPIFKDATLQHQFEKDGFVKLKLLENSIVDELAQRCQYHFPEDSEYFFASSYLNDFERKKTISNEIVDIIASSLQKHFINYRSIGAAFLIKGTGAKSEMPMHQDWTIVDEDLYFSLNIWIPLIATNSSNGTLEVMKGSHNWNKVKRAPTLPFPYEGYQEMIKPHLTVIDTEPGEVVVLNQALIHYSKPNMSEQLRPAITAGIVSKEAQLSLYYWNKENSEELEIFLQDDDFLLKFENFHQSIFERPKLGTSSGKEAYSKFTIEETEFKQLLGVEPTKQEPKKNFFQRLFQS